LAGPVNGITSFDDQFSTHYSVICAEGHAAANLSITAAENGNHGGVHHCVTNILSSNELFNVMYK
jgi:hypothetical protein